VQGLCSEFGFLLGQVDARRRMGAFVLTGSQQFGGLAGITQSLAGRAGTVRCPGREDSSHQEDG
jgi:hypothetical protein